jgi:purine-binding chemotaxis protein CheW
MNLTNQLCTFRIDDCLYGIDALKVQEVLKYQEMTRAPRAPVEVSGLINLRGQIVTAIDLRRRLGLKPKADGRQQMNVVVRDNDCAVSLLVDKIGDVVKVDESCFEEPPTTLASSTRELIQGAYKLEKQLLLLLDVEKVINVGTES